MKLFSEEHKKWARQNYLDMKHAAGVPIGCEFIKIVDGEFIPCSEEEYEKIKEEIYGN